MKCRPRVVVDLGRKYGCCTYLYAYIKFLLLYNVSDNYPDVDALSAGTHSPPSEVPRWSLG